MICVFVIRDKGLVQEFSVQGHSGFDEAGRDIVCAAVSAVVQTAVLGIMDVVGLEPTYRQRDGYLQCILPTDIAPGDRERARVVLETMLVGLRSIQSGYSEYISITEREVG